MLKRYLQKWLGIDVCVKRMDYFLGEVMHLENSIQDIKLTKQNKPQNQSPPIRKKAVRRKS